MSIVRLENTCVAIFRPQVGVRIFRIVSDTSESEADALEMLRETVIGPHSRIARPYCILCPNASAGPDAQFFDWAIDILSAAPLGRRNLNRLRAIYDAAHRGSDRTLLWKACCQLLAEPEVGRLSILVFVFPESAANAASRIRQFITALPPHLRLVVLTTFDADPRLLVRSPTPGESVVRFRSDRGQRSLDVERPGGSWFIPIRDTLSKKFHVDRGDIARWEGVVSDMHLRSLRGLEEHLSDVGAAIKLKSHREPRPIDGSRTIMLLLIGQIDRTRIETILKAGGSEHLYELQHVDQVAPTATLADEPGTLHWLLRKCLEGEEPLVLAFRAMNDVFDFLNSGAGAAMHRIFVGGTPPPNFGTRTFDVEVLDLFLRPNIAEAGHDILKPLAEIERDFRKNSVDSPKAWRMLGDLACTSNRELALRCYQEAEPLPHLPLDRNMSISTRLERLKARVMQGTIASLKDLVKERQKDPYYDTGLLQESNWELLDLRWLMLRQQYDTLLDHLGKQRDSVQQATLYSTTFAIYKWYVTNYVSDRERFPYLDHEDAAIDIRMAEATVAIAWAELVYELGVAERGPFNPATPPIRPGVVISYKTGADTPRVGILSGKLKERGCDAFSDQNLKAGQHWSEEILRRFLLAIVSVAPLTKEYAQSPWCRLEKELLLARAAARGSASHFRAIWLKLGGEENDSVLMRIKQLEIHQPPEWSTEINIKRIVGAVLEALAYMSKSPGLPSVSPNVDSEPIAKPESTSLGRHTLLVVWNEDGGDIVWGERFATELEFALARMSDDKLTTGKCSVQRISGYDKLPTGEDLLGASAVIVVLPRRGSVVDGPAQERLNALLNPGDGASPRDLPRRVIPVAPSPDRLVRHETLEPSRVMHVPTFGRSDIEQIAKVALFSPSAADAEESKVALHIAYSSDDGANVAQSLREQLSRRGFRVVLGEGRERAARKVLERSLVLLVDSSAAHRSSGVQEEIRIAVGQLLPILPIVVVDAQETQDKPPKGGRFAAVRGLGMEVRVSRGAQTSEAIEEIHRKVSDLLLQHARTRRKLFQAGQWRFEDLKFKCASLEGADLQGEVSRSEPSPHGPERVRRFLVDLFPYPRKTPARRADAPGQPVDGARFAARVRIHDGVLTRQDLSVDGTSPDGSVILRPHEISEVTLRDRP